MNDLAMSANRSRAPERGAADRRKLGTLQQWRGDFFGGTVAALIAMPYGMALAMAMGLRPEAGLYTSIIGGAILGMISNAPLATLGLSATVLPVLAVLVRTHGVGAAMAAGALSGLILTLIGALRVGRFFDYLPHPVIAAFTSGLGVIIVSTQIKAVFGVEPAPAGFDLGASVGTVQGTVATWRPCEAHTQETTRSLPLPVPYRPAATRLEPIVPDPAKKEPSAIDLFFKPQRVAIKLKQSSSSGGKNHDKPTTLQTM